MCSSITYFYPLHRALIVTLMAYNSFSPSHFIHTHVHMEQRQRRVAFIHGKSYNLCTYREKEGGRERRRERETARGEKQKKLVRLLRLDFGTGGPPGFNDVITLGKAFYLAMFTTSSSSNQQLYASFVQLC